MVKAGRLKYVLLTVCMIERIQAGLFGTSLPPNGQVQMVVGGK